MSGIRPYSKPFSPVTLRRRKIAPSMTRAGPVLSIAFASLGFIAFLTTAGAADISTILISLVCWTDGFTEAWMGTGCSTTDVSIVGEDMSSSGSESDPPRMEKRAWRFGVKGVATVRLQPKINKSVDTVAFILVELVGVGVSF